MSPARALTAARLQLLWNLARRGRGRLGGALGALVAAVALACLVPPFVMFVSFGTELGGDLAAEGSPAPTWLAGLLALVVLGLGGAAGLRHRGGFDQELLRLFPLRPFQLLLAELPFNLLDTIPVLGFTMLCGLGTGLLRALPGAGLPVALLVAHGMLGLLLVQQATGSARRLAGRSPAVLAAGALLLAVAAAVAALAPDRGMEGGFLAVLDRLPTGLGCAALAAAARGEGGSAAMLQALAAAWTALLAGVAAWLGMKELALDPPARNAARQEERTWTFARPAAGIARLFVAEVAGSKQGRLALVLPVFCTGIFVLAADILRRSALGAEATSLPATASAIFQKAVDLPLWLAVPPAVILFNKDLWSNQFGWDGGGVKALLLAPVTTAEVLRGKLRGLLLVQLPQALLACLPFLRLGLPELAQAAGGLTAAAFAVVVLGTAGHVLSARFPRALGAEGSPPALTLGVTLLVVAQALLTWAVARASAHAGAWAPATAFAVLTALAFGAHRALAARCARSVDERRELLAETLG